MVKDQFPSQPITLTIICPTCGETLIYGVKECRFCRAPIDQEYAEKNVISCALATEASKSAGVIRSFRTLLYILLAMTVFAFFADPPFLEIILFVSILNLIGPIRWLRKYGGITLNNDDVLKAQKDMRVELYLWLSAIIMEAVALSVWLWKL
ncbi:MAG TPA: hypothetical protein VF708_12105 [Pyrinomonadaceae bacterium]